jgi:hypothetical protein
MSTTHADLIAHPVRLRILMTIAGRQLSTQQLAALLPDVPSATLYQHVHKLVEAKILVSVQEIPKRGTVERIYALLDKAAELSRADLSAATPEERWRYFALFLSALAASFRAWLEGSGTEADAHAVLSRAFPLFLTGPEREAFNQEIQALVERYRTLPPTPERHRHLMAAILIPDHPEPGP